MCLCMYVSVSVHVFWSFLCLHCATVEECCSILYWYFYFILLILIPRGAFVDEGLRNFVICCSPSLSLLSFPVSYFLSSVL